MPKKYPVITAVRLVGTCSASISYMPKGKYAISGDCVYFNANNSPFWILVYGFGDRVKRGYFPADIVSRADLARNHKSFDLISRNVSIIVGYR